MTAVMGQAVLQMNGGADGTWNVREILSSPFARFKVATSVSLACHADLGSGDNPRGIGAGVGMALGQTIMRYSFVAWKV
jgi:hypothetical protein